MNSRRTLLAVFLTAVSLAAQSQTPGNPSKLPPDSPLIQDGEVRVDAADFEGNILRVPEERRAGFRMSYDRVVAVVDNVYVTRSIAQKAREAGLDKDPAVQARLRQLQEGYLADLYAQKLEKDAVTIDLEKRARELYIADQEKFMTDEEAHVQQILVGLSCRSNLQAREVALRAYEEAKAGADFLKLADKYSDAGEKANKGGDIGTGPVKRLVVPVRDALAKMKPGEISEPVESPFGFHVLKLLERKPPKAKPFEAVKAEIMAAERARLQRKRLDDEISNLRSSKTVITYRQNVEQLVAPGLDVNDLQRRAMDAQKGNGPAPGATKAQ